MVWAGNTKMIETLKKLYSPSQEVYCLVEKREKKTNTDFKCDKPFDAVD
jgi:hypothetical protein